MFLLYNLLLTLTAPLWGTWMILRARRRREPVDWSERVGAFPFSLPRGKPRLWLHAVSVGEVMAALPILRAVREQDRGLEIVLSVTTSSGHQTARERAEGLYDRLVYFPIDVPRFTLNAMVRVKPTVVAVMETELWFNFLWAAKAVGATTMIVNGRISDRSFPRAQRVAFFYRRLLAMVDRCLVQTPTDAERIQALGGRGVEVLGNTKFDEALQGTGADPDHWRRELGVRDGLPVVVVGSTRSELEETWAVAALRGLQAQTVWAPRHLERAEAVGEMAQAAGLRVARRSEGGTLAGADVLVLDTYGELAQVYSIADVAIIGGGFDRLGGQNILQPLAHGTPVVHGPHMENFRDVAKAATEATVVASSPEELGSLVRGLLDDPARRGAMGLAARELVAQNAGASSRYAAAILHAAARPESG
ncbi:MAG: 3-deoxy-D-manno-octulosonic acid transferase [Fimbriimonadaceae bacterium]|nr:3-deoxy-D-manno-octulosonic acid transferase [Fimbriimonadaceae bacterium]